MTTKAKPRICFLFRSRKNSGIGGAERSMMRLMTHTSPEDAEIIVIFYKQAIEPMRKFLDENQVQWLIADNLIDLYKKLRHLHPNVLYMFARIHMLIWGITAKLAGVLLTVGAERGWADTWIDRLSQHLTKFVVDVYIANSKYAAERLIEAGIKPDHVHVIYNGIDAWDRNAIKSSGNPQFTKPSIVCVANISPRKGHLILLKAINLLKPKYPDLRAILLGIDYTKGAFFAETRPLGLESTYSWVGEVADVKPYLLAADLFALPSYKEGMPTSILEAMLMEKPVVSTKISGVQELIEDGVTGLLVQPGDEKALAEAIDRVLSSEALGVRLGANARKHVLENHTMSKMVSEHLRVFNSPYTKSEDNASYIFPANP
jgi:glycosyltransferase involved in cell wall biosynthesis